MSLKSMAYDNPSYLTRQSFTSIMTAGSAGVSGKFVAFANLLLFSLTTGSTVAGTSTYTTGIQGGTATVAVAATQLSLIRITNTASAGATVALSTSTVGPFTVGGSFLAAGTSTNQIGASNQFALNTATGTAGLNGLSINAGDQFYVVNGTDASAVELLTIDYQIQPLANVTA